MKKTPEDIEITFRIYFEITLSEEECRLLRRLDPEKELRNQFDFADSFWGQSDYLKIGKERMTEPEAAIWLKNVINNLDNLENDLTNAAKEVDNLLREKRLTQKFKEEE